MSSEEALSKVEKELKSLKDELAICQEAKTTGEACKEIIDHCQKSAEPFSVPDPSDEPNKWHKNPSKKGGCIIL